MKKVILMGSIFIISYAMNSSSDLDKIKEGFKEDDYKIAIEKYINLDNDEIKSLHEMISKECSEILNKYKESDKNEATKYEAMSKLEELLKLNQLESKNTIVKTMNYVSELHKSDKAFNNGLSFLTDEKYELALKEFKKVIKEDTKNYSQIKEKIDHCLDFIK